MGVGSMILVRAIGMSGYVPLEGVACLVNYFWSDDLVGCERKFSYLYHFESSTTDLPTILQKVVSFVTLKRFSDYVCSVVIREVGLLSGYYRAGVVFPQRLLSLLRFALGLRDYDFLAYVLYFPSYLLGQAVYTTAWAEYISVDFVDRFEGGSYFSVRVLGRHEVLIPTFSCGELRDILQES
jgi:hypothetical protein